MVIEIKRNLKQLDGKIIENGGLSHSLENAAGEDKA